jgi:hypothetical protein
LRYVLRSTIPPFTRLLLVESGSRAVLDRLVPVLYEKIGEQMEIDLITCHSGEPVGFRGRVWRVSDYSTAKARAQLVTELRERDYRLTGILCTGEPIMTKWKWALALRVPAKLFLVNENADFMFFDWANRTHLRKLAAMRTGLTGGSALSTVAHAVSFPFALAFLLLYAGAVHLRRRLRLLTGGASRPVA